MKLVWLKNLNANVLGGKSLKTKLVATNATTNATLAAVQKELTGTNSGQTDVLLKTLNATNATADATTAVISSTFIA